MLKQIAEYIREVVNITGKHYLYVLDLVGAVLLFWPNLARSLISDLTLVRGAGFTLFVIAFVIASFLVYQKHAAWSDVRFELVGEQHANMSGEGPLRVERSGVQFGPSFDIGFQVVVAVSNAGAPTSVRFFVQALEPAFLEEGLTPSDVDIRIDPVRGPAPLENPFRLDSDDMRNLRLTGRIPSSVESVESNVGSLSRLRKLTVTLGAELPGRRAIPLVVELSLEHAHQRLEERVVGKLEHGQNLPTAQVVQALKRYWTGTGGDTTTG